MDKDKLLEVIDILDRLESEGRSLELTGEELKYKGLEITRKAQMALEDLYVELEKSKKKGGEG